MREQTDHIYRPSAYEIEVRLRQQAREDDEAYEARQAYLEAQEDAREWEEADEEDGDEE